MIEQAMEKVYEAITGKCWHKQDRDNILRCHKCGMCPVPYGLSYRNPDLATSLDAWREHIWPVMNINMKMDYYILFKDVGHRERIFLWELTPMHHLEAALRMLGEDELAGKLRLIEKEG